MTTSSTPHPNEPELGYEALYRASRVGGTLDAGRFQRLEARFIPAGRRAEERRAAAEQVVTDEERAHDRRPAREARASQWGLQGLVTQAVRACLFVEAGPDTVVIVPVYANTLGVPVRDEEDTRELAWSALL